MDKPDRPGDDVQAVRGRLFGLAYRMLGAPRPPMHRLVLAQSAFQTKLTALIEAYKAECDRMQG